MTFANLDLFPLYDKDTENTIHKHNVINKDLKESIGLDNNSLLIGHYVESDNYLIVKMIDGEYTYQIYDGESKSAKMNFEFVLEIVALEISYASEYDEFMEIINKE